MISHQVHTGPQLSCFRKRQRNCHVQDAARRRTSESLTRRHSGESVSRRHL